ncbi:MAG TPA: Fic family protein [Segetibacter sp.]|jgi:Fic family protein
MSYLEKRNQIDVLQQQISAHGELSDDVKKKINYKFRLDWNYYSNSMEGNTLTMDETRSVMVGNLTVGGKPIKDVLEIKGHDEVISDILKIGKGEARLSEKRIRDIHRAIMYEDDEANRQKIGSWKTEPNYLFNYKKERFDFVAPADVPARMHELLNRTNASIDAIQQNKRDAPHPVDVALQFHLDYVLIHPFYDGNGRTARILTNLLLISFGYPPFWVNTKERNIYSQYLGDIQGYGGDPELFFDFAAGMILRSQQLVLDAIDGKNIVEDDDLAKEIELWKKYAAINKIEGLHRNDDLVYELFQSGVKEMFKQFDERLKPFHDMFQKATTYAYKNNSSSGGIEWLSNEIDQTILKPRAQFLDAGESPEPVEPDDTFRNIMIQVHLQEYKHGTDAFSIHASIKFEFGLYKYDVLYADKKIERKYGEFLNSDERKEIVIDAVKAVFEQVKRKAQ